MAEGEANSYLKIFILNENIHEFISFLKTIKIFAKIFPLPEIFNIRSLFYR